MRDFNRRSEAKSGRATPDELREASQRYKEIQGELQQMELAPVTKQGEERLDRYEREMRLRAMREEFQDATGTYPRPPRNPAMLALLMTISSFLLCAFCAGGTYFGLELLGQKPSATDVASGFWSAIQAKDYTTAHDTYLSPVLTQQLPGDSFAAQAQAADSQSGPVTSVALTKQDKLSATSLALTYGVTRTDAHNGKHLYNVTLTLQQVRDNWLISDVGAVFSPQPGPSPSGTPGAKG